MKITTYIFEKKKKETTEGTAYLGFRVRSKIVDIKVRTEIEVVGEFWDCDSNSYVKTRKVEKCKRAKTNELVEHIMETINGEFYDESMKGTADADWVRGVVERWLHPQPNATPSFAERIEQYVMEHPMADSTAYNYLMTAKKVRRYDAYQRDIDGKTGLALMVETITVEELEDFRDFLINEHLLYEELPEFFAQFHIKVQDVPKQLSQTRVGNIMTHLRIVQHWCNNMGYCKNKSCDELSIPQPTFGTPFYLTIEERNRVFEADLSYRPSLILYRDLFVFQSLVGCRSGDLFKFTKDNIQNDMLVFIPEKTNKRNPTPVEVPLSGKAKEIIARYDGMEGNKRLFPKRDMTHYNNGIKDILRDLGIDRPVTILNKYTKVNEQKPICDVASSHMARRTFIGNLYKKVKDPSNHWSSELQGYKPRVSLVAETKRMAFDKSVHELRDIIAEKYYRGANGDWLKGVIEEYHHPNINKYNGKLEQNNLVARIKEYIGTRQLAKASVDHFNYYIRKIEHFERYEQMVNKHRGYKMNIDTMNADTLTRFCTYLRNEHEIYVEHPEVFEDKASKYAPRQLSDNSLNTLFHKLNTKTILAKYEDIEGELLFPSFTLDTYNENIRKILTHVGVTHRVATINPKTREFEIHPLNEIATSHTARKSFIGNLYKKVKDPALVASLSGHTDGSRAFARYREIDTEMKRELVKMIE